jgi:tyrosinase
MLIEGIHASVHTWVGGAMTLVSVAAYDPLFWAHHAMIDRLWYLWQIDTHERPPADLLDRALWPFPMTVRQTLDIGLLGYEYAVRVVG